jgi:hypothetical protein
MEEQALSLEEQLKTVGFFVLPPRGVSMWPLLRNGRDSVRIEPLADVRALRVGDVPVYRRENGQLVLHRVRYVAKDGYLMCGDNQSRMEFVPFSWVFGVMTAYYRDEKEHSLHSFAYRCYVRLYCGAPLWLRRAFLYCVRLPRRAWGKLRRTFSKK